MKFNCYKALYSLTLINIKGVSDLCKLKIRIKDIKTRKILYIGIYFNVSFRRYLFLKMFMVIDYLGNNK